MKNYVHEGHTLDLTGPTGGATSGTVYKIGSIIGVACHDVAQGVIGQFKTNGVYDYAKATGAAWGEGDLLYWDDTAKNFTKTASTNQKAGVAVVAALSGDTTGRVKLIPSI